MSVTSVRSENELTILSKLTCSRLFQQQRVYMDGYIGHIEEIIL